MRRGFSEVLAHLIDILLIALLDLFAEEILERTVAQTFIATLRKIRYQV